MSIRLCVEANDGEVENLLAYLDSQSSSPDDKIYLLERATKWLRASQAIAYSVSPDQGVIQLVLGAPAPTSLLDSDRPVLQHEG
jgi:hypothetical protein